MSDYENCLSELREQGSVRWILRRREFPRWSGSRQRSPQQLIDDVLLAPRVQSAVEQLMADRRWPRDAAQAEARLIAQEMGHQFQLTTVRAVAFAVTQVIQEIFDGIYVNSAQLAEVRRRVGDTPMVFMPSHKTYMDFLLVTYVCFHYEVPLPAIAAGMDFMAMRLVGEALRRCGAFYIRRSFGSDALYWAVFSEYVQTHLRNGDRPVEFFVEGTRSRTGKSLHPKYGLMTTLLEPYFRSQMYDLLVVPVGINYEKILEESLFAYELLGYPKPVESTSGLLKARRVLRQRFGDVFVTFGEPVSARDYLGARASRAAHALEPVAQFSLNDTERAAVRQFAHRVVKLQQDGCVVSLWPLVADALGAALAQSRAVTVGRQEVEARVDRLLDLTRRLGVAVQLRGQSVSADVDYFVALHSNLIEASGDTLRLLTAESGDRSGGPIDAESLALAIPHIMLGNYANTASHLYADAAMLSVQFLLAQSLPNTRTALFDGYTRLRVVFAREFITVPGDGDESFETTLQQLLKAALVEEGADAHVYSAAIRGDLLVLADLLKPFVVGYAIVCDVVADSPPSAAVEQLVERYQAQVQRLIRSRRLPAMYRLLSKDIARNALDLLVARKILVADSSQHALSAPLMELRAYLGTICTMLDVPLDVAQAKL